MANFKLRLKFKKEMSLSCYMENCISDLKCRQKYVTAMNYRKTLNSFTLFLGKRTPPISKINQELMDCYCQWLMERQVSKNSISFYMRNLRSVFNKAAKSGLTIIDKNPFKNVYTGVDKTKKRAVNEEVVLRLQGLDLSHYPALALSRDLFIFSYCTRGMAFIDIAFLRKDSIRDGTILYRRHKTGQELAIKIEPCTRRIIDRYRDATASTPYVFPIITCTDSEKAWHQYQTALAYHNRKLKKLGKLAGEELPISSYTARHTWATAARNHNIPISVISAGMGHTSEKTTRIYLASIDNSVIDTANKALLQGL
ncbi:MAG: tyrosine-type recombinase/integrase [Candidatus Cryptobacteroides sp.]